MKRSFQIIIAIILITIVTARGQKPYFKSNQSITSQSSGAARQKYRGSTFAQDHRKQKSGSENVKEIHIVPHPKLIIRSKTGHVTPYGYWPWMLPTYFLPKFIPRGIYRGDQDRDGSISINGGYYGGRIENPTQLINTEWGMVPGRGYDDSFVKYNVDGIHESPFCDNSCEPGHFLCQIECKCIVLEERCNHEVNCQEGEDEMQCDDVGMQETSVVKCDESHNFILCPKTELCVSKRWLCDGEDDCGDFSDETQCESGVYIGYTKNCSSKHFQCTNKLCIPQDWLCDNDNDCRDFSDETNCTLLGCDESEFECGDGTCVSRTWRCDSHIDCMDGSDEDNCDMMRPPCNDDEFICNSGKCVKLEFKCDGDDDCEDWSDEYECIFKNLVCLHDEFKCNNGQCLPSRWVCDNQSDCVEGEDEHNCDNREHEPCKADEYLCPQGHCILKNWVCDGTKDCLHGEDETNCDIVCDNTQFACTSSTTSKPSTSQSDSQLVYPSDFKTDPMSPKTAFCIPAKHRCDGSKDCPKGEDEFNCPQKRNCENNTKCHQLCITFPNGTKGCACHRGYQLADDGFSCEDVDECAYITDPVCSQNCNNTIGSFKCSCMTGYVLRPDLRTCKALGGAPTLLFANRADIRQMSPSNSHYSLLIKGTHNAIALSYHYKQELVFWSDVTMQKIKKSTIYDANTTNVVSTGLESPGGIAVDWIHNLLFWTDSGTKRIEVCNIEGTYRVVLAASDLDKPRAIAAHPGEALIFWTDWGPHPKIERAEMDGRNRRSIITQSIFWPNGLTLDYTANQLYWADAKHNVIETALFDGSKRRKIITKGLPHPFALTIFEDTLFWTDWHTKSITRVNKQTGTGYKILHAQILFPMDIQSFHPQRQPNFKNHCGRSNGGCEHLCLPNKESYTCVCVLGQKLRADKRTCQKPDKFIMFTRRKDIRIKHLEGSTKTQYQMVIPVKDIKNVIGFAWDAKSERIYWSDINRKSITMAYWNGTDEQDIVDNNLVLPFSIAIDWLTDKIYFSDAGNSRIEVCNLKGDIRALLIWEDIDKPHDIILDPQKALMFWSDWGENPRIERAHMDGSNRKIIVHSDLASPSGLTIDHSFGKLYWADGNLQKISSVNMDGNERRTIIEGDTMKYPFGLDVFENTIYWTDALSKTIERANKLTGKNRTIVIDDVEDPMSIRIFHKHRKYGKTACHIKNGGCSHMCLLKPKGSSSCTCPTGIMLLKDRKTCQEAPHSYLLIAHRMYIRQLSLDVPYRIDVVLPLKHLKLVTSVDVDRKTGEIYWSDTAERMIRKSSPDGQEISIVLADEIECPDGIAIDSAGRKIYWTDAHRRSVEVAELDGSLRKVLFTKRVYNPRAITLHYHYGLLFWSDWGDKSKIEVATMDGSNRKIIVKENIVWPNGLAIDRPEKRLFWNDAKLETIESSDLNGENRRQILHGVSHPYGLVVVGNHVYWTDWNTESLHRADKDTGNDSTVIIKDAMGLMDVRSVEKESIEENACGKNNGGCSHLCLRNPKGYSCACPTGILKMANGTHCELVAHTFLLTALRFSINQISFDTGENWDVTLPIYDDMIGVIDVDFHYKHKIIFWSDITMSLIKSVSLYNLSDVKIVVGDNLTSPESIAVDWLADNIYWSNSGYRVIEVAKITGQYRKVVINRKLGLVRSITCNPQRGHLYWTNWMPNIAKIERSNYDGSERKDIVATNLYFPMGLTLDFANKRLYWIDARPDDQRIETTDYHGYNRVTLSIEKSHPFSLTQYKNWIYWTDWVNKTILRASKMDGNDKTPVKLLNAALGIKMVSEEKQPGWNPCLMNNGNCPYLCFYQKESYTCPCRGIRNTNCTIAPIPRVPNVCPKNSGYDCQIDRDPKGGWFNILGSIKPENGNDSHIGSRNENSGTRILIISLILSFLFVIIMGSLFLWCYLSERNGLKFGDRAGRSFSNPNYYSSDPGSAEKHPMDRKQLHIWKRFKYDKAQERVFEETVCGQSNHHDLSNSSVSNYLIPNEPERETVIIESKEASIHRYNRC